MDTAAYEKLLSELGIPSEWDAENKESLLDEKYSEALELLDVAQQNGEEDKIARLDDEIKKIEDALEYTKEIKKRLSSGLVLNTQSDQDRLEELKGTGKEEGTQKVKQFETASQPATNTPAPQQAANTPAPQPQVSSSSANPLLQSQMRRAKMELEDENWRLAAQLYNDILNAEPENAEANLGLFMANQRIRERKAIPEAARDAMKNNLDIFQDKQFLRAMRYADDSLQKELESCKKGGYYLIAIEALQRANTIEEYQAISEIFDNLDDFADSRKYKEESDGHWQKLLYDATVQAMPKARSKEDFAEIINNFDKLGDYEDAREKRQRAAYSVAVRSLLTAKDVSDFSAAKEMFEDLGDYSDSKEKIKECEDKIKQRQGQQDSYEKYKQEYDKFEKEVVDLPEIKQHESAIAGQRERIDSLKRKGKGNLIQKRWIFIMGVLGGLLFFVSDIAKLWEVVPEFWVLEELGEGVIYFLMPWRYPEMLSFIFTEGRFAGAIFVIIFAIIFGCWVYLSWEYEVELQLIRNFFRAVLSFIFLLASISLIYRLCIVVAETFGKQAHLIGIVALVITAAMIAKNIMGSIMVNSRTAEIRRLEWSIGDDYENIGKIIAMEYQKIYDRYPDAGSDRVAVSKVQSRLMDDIRKRNGAG